jgi:thiamine pyrophosphate-dependent acetolactate synthase large subunit-like protein
MVDVFKSLDIEYCTTNPGSSFEYLQESLINYGDNESPELLTCLHEESAVAMAHGYAKVEGKPIMALLHGTVGLMHGSMAIYNAYADRVPVYIVAGNHNEPSGTVNPYHSAQDLGGLVRDYVKWDSETHTLNRFAESAVRAYKIAMTPPMGPVLVTIDHDLQGESLTNHPDLHVPVYTPAAPPQGDRNAVAEAARLIVDAERPHIVCERSARTQRGVELLVELAELLQAPVNGGERLNFPNRHPLHRFAAAPYEPDLVLGLEVNDMSARASQLRRSGGRSISISSVDLSHKSNIHDFGRYAEVDVAIAADAEATLPALIEEVRRLVGSGERRRFEQRAQLITDAHRNAHEQDLATAARGWNSSPVSTARLSAELWAQIKDDDWSLVSPQRFVSHWPLRLWTMDRRHQYIGEQGAGGIGYGAPASVGAALANKKHGRLSVSIQCDGDLNFAPGVLWTAVHHQIPLLFVMHNNRAYHAEVMFVQRSCNRHRRGENRAHIGTAITDPNISYSAMAGAYGMYAEGPIHNPADLGPAIRRGLERVRNGEPALIDVLTQPR